MNEWDEWKTKRVEGGEGGKVGLGKMCLSLHDMSMKYADYIDSARQGKVPDILSMYVCMHSSDSP